jgi:hypothetical protein
MTISRTAKIGVSIAAFVIFTAALYGTSRVVRDVTEEDETYAYLIVGDKPNRNRARQSSYEEQIAFVRKVQRSVLKIAPVNVGIPYGASREPKDLYQGGHGLCFDRSWTIEKILASNGFEVRHVALYRSHNRWLPRVSLIIPGIPSHAVSEVRTAKGWLVVDSNREWISVDNSGDPVSLSNIHSEGIAATIWDTNQTNDLAPIFADRFVFVYGLYSRHGYFFPPFLPVPDVHWDDVLHNVF